MSITNNVLTCFENYRKWKSKRGDELFLSIPAIRVWNVQRTTLMSLLRPVSGGDSTKALK